MNNDTVVKEMSNTKTLVINGLCIALVFVATGFINIRLPIAANGGLIHLGNVPLFIAAIVFGKKTGALAGAFGMAFFDLFSGWTMWAPFTFVIVGIMGYVVGKMTENQQGKSYGVYTMAILMAMLIKIIGYYLAEVILYGNLIQPMASIPGNVMQIAVAGIIVIPMAWKIKKIALTIL